MAATADGISPNWGIEALRERLRGAQIGEADLQRRYDELATAYERLHRQAQRLYSLLSPEVKAALEVAEQERLEDSRERSERMLRAAGIRA